MPSITLNDNTYEIIASEIRLGTSLLKRELFPPIPERITASGVLHMPESTYRTYKSLMAGLAAYDAAWRAGYDWRRCKREKRKAILAAKRAHPSRS